MNFTNIQKWAGVVWADSECGSLAPTCEEYVANNPAAFTEAYWAINKVHVYQDTESTPSSTAVLTPSATSSSISEATSAHGHPPFAGPRKKRSGGAVIPR